MLLDLNAAFDMIDHLLFLEWLSNDYSVPGSISDWMRYYLLGREQKVAINSSVSDSIE